MLKNYYDKHGSVLLMVVGLLVILGTLGGTFLLVSSLDARQSKLLAGRGKAERIASGGVGKVVRVLGEDLHFATGRASSPYSAPNITGDDKYKFFMDHTSVDAWLHGTDHPSDVFGTGLGDGSLVSTESDGGGAGDAYLVPAGEFSDDGEQYYIAIKVVDMSSLLSLNTGGEDYLSGTADTSQILKSPALIKLKQWMGGVYADIHRARCGVSSGNPNLTIFDRECGRRLLSPVDSAESSLNLNYLPFAIADEVYLRWLGSGGKANFGRVFKHLGNTSIDKRRLMTTISSARSIVRSPITEVITSRIDLSKADSLESDAKEALYAQIVLIAGSDDGKGGTKSGDTVRKLIDDSSGSGFHIGHALWLPTGVPNAYNDNCRRYQGTVYKAWWIFDDLPQASYRVWTSWGSSVLAAGSNIPYVVYQGGAIKVTSSIFGSTASFSGGTLKGTYVANQTELPSDDNYGGQRWQSLGSHWVEGRLVVEINGPQGVPSGQTAFAFADAVRIEGVGVELGSGSQPAAHLTANSWAAMSLHEPAKAFAFRPPGKNYTVFGVQEQPFITEAFATHTTRTQNTDGTWVEDSWKWGAAIELMNFSSKAIDLKDYRLVFGSALDNNTALQAFPANSKIPAATNTNGGRLVLYDFRAGKGDVTANDVFGTNVGQWKQVDGLNFDSKTIRLVRIAKDNNDANKEYRIPIDHVVAIGDATKGDLTYEQLTSEVITSIEPGKTVASNCRRDDSVTNCRYAVAMYSKTGPTVGNVTSASHRLGRDNGAAIAESVLKKGFRIKLRHGLFSGPGGLSELYLVGPIVYDDASSPPADMPELLKEFAPLAKKSHGRANSHAEGSTKADFTASPWNTYPRTRGGQTLAWPLLLGEVVETVPMDLQRGDSPTRVYGRLNVNTASHDALKLLPWPDGVNASAGATQIIAYRGNKGGFVTPGEVTLAFADGLGGANTSLDRDAIYAAISGCITVNSDMYAVTVRVQLGGSKTPPADKSWYYLAVIDRGCAVFSNDKPAVLLFTQVR